MTKVTNTSQGRVKCTCASSSPFFPPPSTSMPQGPSSSFQSRCTGLETKRDTRNTPPSVCKQSRRLRRPHCTPFERNDTVQNEAEQGALSHGSVEREWNIEAEEEGERGGRCRGVVQVRRGSNPRPFQTWNYRK